MLVYESNNEAFAFSEDFASQIVLPSDYLTPVAVPEVYNQLQDKFNTEPIPLLTYPKGGLAEELGTCELPVSLYYRRNSGADEILDLLTNS